jgi:hypothetical protein
MNTHMKALDTTPSIPKQPIPIIEPQRENPNNNTSQKPPSSRSSSDSSQNVSPISSLSDSSSEKQESSKPSSKKNVKNAIKTQASTAPVLFDSSRSNSMETPVSITASASQLEFSGNKRKPIGSLSEQLSNVQNEGLSGENPTSITTKDKRKQGLTRKSPRKKMRL